MTLAERAAKLMPVLSEQRAAVARKTDRRLQGRGHEDQLHVGPRPCCRGCHAAAHGRSFDKLGFGAWMPFRFPDQWLMFCSVMQRVLAANGLIHSSHPEIYRRLLEETPPVDWPEGILDTGSESKNSRPRKLVKMLEQPRATEHTEKNNLRVLCGEPEPHTRHRAAKRFNGGYGGLCEAKPATGARISTEKSDSVASVPTSSKTITFSQGRPADSRILGATTLSATASCQPDLRQRLQTDDPLPSISRQI